MRRLSLPCAPATRSLLAGVALSACALLQACAGEPPELGPMAPVEAGRLERIVVATGTIEPEREVEVRPRIPGIVEKLHVKAGDRVEAGALLAELDRELLEVQLQEARAEVQRARVELRLAESALERATKLRSQGAATERDLDEARAAHDGAKAVLAMAEARERQYDVQVRYTTIRAPIGGKVLDVPIEEGSAVSAVSAVTGGTPLMTLAQEDPLHLEGLVDENEVKRISVGQAARVRTEAYGDQVFEGRVRKIAPIGERKQNVTYFEVEVEIVDPQADKLRPRMSGDADIVTEVVEQAVIAPETSIIYDGDGIYVETVDEGDPPSVERKAIEIGIVDGDRVQVTRGVAAGEVVRLH